jgi:UDP-N-acetylmuramoyl-tripeptide--D-alanyl-D-alanine ligase
MEPQELREIIERMGGRWVAPTPPPRLRVAELGTDSRTISDNAIFVALQGPRFDGHAFLGEARRRGAVASIVSRSRVDGLSPESGPYIAVDDPLEALESVARWNREHLDLEVVAVTGSVGKTSTKEFLATVLAGRFEVRSAPKSFNNRIGVAVTLLSAGPRTEVLVVELGASGPGEISFLSRAVRPRRVVLTEIAPAHLEGFGDLAGVVAAKSEVFEGLEEGGSAVLKHGVEGFERFRARVKGPVRTFGWGAGDYAITDCQRVRLGSRASPGHPYDDYGYHFTLNGTENFILPVPGRHNVANAAAAIAVARDLGMRWEEIRSSLAECRLPPLRFEVTEQGGVVVVDDSYNASPRSMEAAIDEWLELAAPPPVPAGKNGAARQLVAVLGDMLEMGSASRRLHEDVGCRLASSGARLLVTIGGDSRWIAEAFRREGGGADTVHFASAKDALPLLQRDVRPGDRVLFKASRGIGLDALVKQFKGWLASVGPACDSTEPRGGG